jgi:Gp49-like protein DUF891
MSANKQGSKTWNWRFLGFETLKGNRPVQDWFDALDDEGRNELLDTLYYLRALPNHLWRRPKFDHLEGDISEIIGWTASDELRIYGYFPGLQQTYMFLNGKSKKVANDKHGKRIAKDRLKLLRRGEAGFHEFEFNRDSTQKTEQK